MTLANILHPDLFAFGNEKEADGFYRRFYGVPYRGRSGGDGTPDPVSSFSDRKHHEPATIGFHSVFGPFSPK